jgi:hypothetical protein
MPACPWEKEVVFTTASFYQALTHTFRLLLLDIWLIIQVFIIALTMFEFHHLICRSLRIRQYWFQERDRHAEYLRRIHEAPHPCASSIQTCLDLADRVETASVFDVPVLIELSNLDGAPVSTAAISTTEGEPARGRDASCCSYAWRQFTAWHTAFWDGLDFDNGGMFGYMGWFNYHAPSFSADSAMEKVYQDSMHKFEAREFRDSKGWHSAFHRDQRGVLGNDPQYRMKGLCSFYFHYPASLSFFAALVEEHFVLALTKGLLNFFRIPLKLWARILAIPNLALIVFSVLGSCFVNVKETVSSQRFTFREEIPVLSYLGLVNVLQFITLSIFLAVQFLTAMFPFIIYEIITSQCTSSPIPVTIASVSSTMSSYQTLKDAGISVSWCLGQFITSEVVTLGKQAPLWIWVCVLAWTAVAVVPMLYFLYHFSRKLIPTYHPLDSTLWFVFCLFILFSLA